MDGSSMDFRFLLLFSMHNDMMQIFLSPSCTHGTGGRSIVDEERGERDRERG